MYILTRVRRLLDSVSEVRECRRCGTTLEPDAEECDTCGAKDIATYRIE